MRIEETEVCLEGQRFLYRIILAVALGKSSFSSSAPLFFFLWLSVWFNRTLFAANVIRAALRYLLVAFPAHHHQAQIATQRKKSMRNVTSLVYVLWFCITVWHAQSVACSRAQWCRTPAGCSTKKGATISAPALESNH